MAQFLFLWVGWQLKCTGVRHVKSGKSSPNKGFKILVLDLYNHAPLSVSIRTSLTNSAISATAGRMPCCSASAWSAPPPFKMSGRSGCPRSAAAAPSLPSSSWARSATCGRTSKCWSSSRDAGRGRCWRKMPGRCRKKSARWRTLSARRWHKRIWRRCLMRPSLWGCGTLTGERGGRGRSAAQLIRWRCSLSPGGRSMYVCSKVEGRYDPVTDDKTGTADTYAGTEMDLKTLTRAQSDFNVVEPSLSRGLSFRVVADFGIFSVWPEMIPSLMPQRERQVWFPHLNCSIWLWSAFNQKFMELIKFYSTWTAYLTGRVQKKYELTQGGGGVWMVMSCTKSILLLCFWFDTVL